MQFITLTTEWTTTDFYLGAIKGAILNNHPDCRFIDIAHNIPKYNIALAAFSLRNCYKQYPDETIHLICIDTEANENSKHLVVKHYNQYFICNDNGLLGLLFDTIPDKIIQLETLNNQTSFPELYVFASVAIHILAKKDIKELGDEIHEYNKKVSFLPSVETGKNEIIITGNVIYIDSYENVITNITKRQFEELAGNKKFVIYPNTTFDKYVIKKIDKSYHETPPGEITALFNSSGLLEIAQIKGKAGSALNIKVNNNIRIVIK